MASLNPYLTFNGNCREAMNFYKDCLGGELKILTVGDSPAAAQMPKATHGSVMHSSLAASSILIMASDMFDSISYAHGNAISLMLVCASEEEISTLFTKLSTGGKVNSPLKIEFWGATFGDLTDKFGMRWMLNYEKPKA